MRLRAISATQVGFFLGVALSASLAVAQGWSPPQPGEDNWDWIQMKSGEWFKGEIKSLRDRDLEFDSAELDILKLDWADVAVLRTPTVFSFRVESAGIFVGTAVLQNGQLTIRSTDGSERTFPQAQLLLIVPGAGRELDFWSVKATFKDRFQNIRSRSTLATGLGYQLIKTGKIDWDISFSGGYQNTYFASVQEGQASSEDNFSAIPSTTFSFDITSDVELDFDYNAQIGIPDPKRSFHHANLVIAIDIWGNLLDLDLSITWDRTESPTTDADGKVPKRDDLRTAIGLGIEF